MPLSRFLSIAPLLLFTVATPRPNDGRATVRAAIAFMGGEEALRGVRTRYSVWNEVITSIGQEEIPGQPAPTATQTATYTWDYGRNLLRRLNVPSGVDPGNVATFIVQGEAVGISLRDSIRAVGGNGSLRAAQSIQRQARTALERVLIEALALDDSKLRPVASTRIAGRNASGVELSLESDTLTLWVDPFDGRPLALDAKRPDPLFGERVEREAYLAWRWFGKLRAPVTVRTTWNGAEFRLAIASSIEINAPRVDSLPALSPDMHVTPVPTPPTVVRELAPNIVRIEGSDGNVNYGGGVPYYSFAVREGDSVFVIEAPLAAERGHEVIDSARSHFAGARVTSLIVTHAHYDHIGGVPAAMDAGLRVIAARELIPFLRDLAVPARRRRTFAGVDDSLTIGSGDARFVLYRVPTLHARGMLVAYFPAHQLMIESDMAGFATPAQQRELVSWVTMRRLPVDRIAGAHGPVTTWADFAAKVK